jgi:hypothetical protein
MQIVSLHQVEKLTNLVRLRFRTKGLKIENFGDLGVNVEMMATSNVIELEPERFEQMRKIAEIDVTESAAEESLEQPFRLHAARASRQGRMTRSSRQIRAKRLLPAVVTRSPSADRLVNQKKNPAFLADTGGV